MTRVIALGLGLVLAAGCARTQPASTLPSRFTRAVDPNGLRLAILAGLTARGFAVAREGVGEIDGFHQGRRYTVRVRVRYDQEGYAIQYLDSRGLHEQLRRGVMHVDRRYLRHATALHREIQQRAAYLPPPSAAPTTSPPSYGASGGLGAPVTAAGEPTASPPVASPPSPGPSAPPPAPAQGGAAAGLGAPASAPPAAGPYPGAAPSPAADYAPVAQAPGPVAPAIAPAPERPPPPEARGPRRSFWELAGPGIGLLIGSWVGNWAASAAVQGGDLHLGLSFVPVLGPWLQLPELQWSVVPRWTGWFHPLMGLLQAAGLAMTVVGLVVQVDDAEPDRASLELRLTPGGAALRGWF